MNAKRVVDTILRNNNFYSYTVTLNSKISRCNFNRQGNTEIQLESYERKEEELIVAAHEASHVLNYNENVTNLKLLLCLEKLMKFTLLGLPVFSVFMIIRNLLMIDSTNLIDFIFNSYTLLCFASGTSYYLYYGRDEALTEKRALKELEKGIFPLIDNELKFLIVNENKTRIVTWVYKKVFLLLIGLILLLLFLRFLPELLII